MSAALTLSLLLACVLVVSGAPKLLDPRGSAATLRGFAVPGPLVAPFALLLPIAELGIAAALLIPATSRLAAAAAVALFAGFTLAIGVTLARGRRPDCGCFGRLHSRPVGRATLTRTAALAGIAAVPALAGPGEGLATLLREPAAWLGLVAAAQSLLLFGLLRRHGRLLARLDEAPVELVRPAGAEAVLLFTTPGCPPCDHLRGELPVWRRRLAGLPIEEVSTEREEGLELAMRHGVEATPSAAYIGAGGASSELAVGVEEITRFFAALVQSEVTVAA